MLFWEYYRFSTFINTSVSDVTDCSSLYNIPNDKLLDGLVFWYTSSTVCATNKLHMTTPLLASSIISSFRSLKKKSFCEFTDLTFLFSLNWLFYICKTYYLNKKSTWYHIRCNEFSDWKQNIWWLSLQFEEKSGNMALISCDRQISARLMPFCAKGHNACFPSLYETSVCNKVLACRNSQYGNFVTNFFCPTKPSYYHIGDFTAAGAILNDVQHVFQHGKPFLKI